MKIKTKNIFIAGCFCLLGSIALAESIEPSIKITQETQASEQGQTNIENNPSVPAVEQSTNTINNPAQAPAGQKTDVLPQQPSSDKGETTKQDQKIIGTDTAVSSGTPKNIDIEIKSVQDSEKMTFEADIPKKDVIKEVFDAKSKPDSPFLKYDELHKKHGVFFEKSSVRLDFVEAGSYSEPPENHIYVYEIPNPEAYKGWELKVVNSAGEILWDMKGKGFPSAKVVWDGYDKNGEWKAVLGEQYSFVFKAKNIATKKYEYWENPFIIESYIVDRGKGVAIRVSCAAVFDEKGLNITERGKKILRKVYYKMKSSKYKNGIMEIRSMNVPLANVQLEQVVAYAKENRVDMGIIVTQTTELTSGISYFEILLTKRTK